MKERLKSKEMNYRGRLFGSGMFYKNALVIAVPIMLHDEEYLHGLQYYGAYDGEKLIGEIAIRPDRKHICFFFVDGRYHRRGIGTRMFQCLLEDYPDETITLNSSPYGRPFYKAIGFVPTDEEKTVNGIRFTPMKYEGK